MAAMTRDELDALQARRRAAFDALDRARQQHKALRGQDNTAARVEWGWIEEKCRREHTRLCNLLDRLRRAA